MRCARLVCLVALSVLALAAVGGSRAEAQRRAAAMPEAPTANPIDERVRKLFETGRAAYDVGDYSRALESFQQAYELSDRPQLLYNIGQCADRLRLDETALAAFRRYVERVPDAANRYQVEQRISVLEDVVSTKLNAASGDDAAGGAAEPEPSALDASMRPSGSGQSDTADSSIWSKWWLWAAAGGVVAITVVGIAIASSGSEQKEGDAVTGSDGNVVATLRWSGP